MRTIFLFLGMFLVLFHSSMNELRANAYTDCSSAVHALHSNHFSEISFIVGSDLFVEDDDEHIMKEKKCAINLRISKFSFSELTNAALLLVRTLPRGKYLSFPIPLYLSSRNFRI
jgi:hypothetical protein